MYVKQRWALCCVPCESWPADASILLLKMEIKMHCRECTDMLTAIGACLAYFLM